MLSFQLQEKESLLSCPRHSKGTNLNLGRLASPRGWAHKPIFRHKAWSVKLVWRVLAGSHLCWGVKVNPLSIHTKSPTTWQHLVCAGSQPWLPSLWHQDPPLGTLPLPLFLELSNCSWKVLGLLVLRGGDKRCQEKLRSTYFLTWVTLTWSLPPPSSVPRTPHLQCSFWTTRYKNNKLHYCLEKRTQVLQKWMIRMLGRDYVFLQLQKSQCFVGIFTVWHFI